MFLNLNLKWIDMLFITKEKSPFGKSEDRRPGELMFLQYENIYIIVSGPSSSGG